MRDAEEIFEHPFFEGIDFQSMELKQIQPPYQFDQDKPFKFFDQKLI